MTPTNRQETKDLIAKLKQIEIDISKEKGSFSLYAMFRKKAETGNWDIVMAAEWLTDESIWDFSKYVVNLWRLRLSNKEMATIDMILINDRDKKKMEKTVEELKPVEHGEDKVKDIKFLGQEHERGIIITARPSAVTA